MKAYIDLPILLYKIILSPSLFQIGNKRKGDVEQETIHEKTNFTKVYGASKRRKKILIEEPEEEDTEDVPIGQFVKGKPFNFTFTMVLEFFFHIF